MARFSGAKKFFKWTMRLVIAGLLLAGWALALLAVHVVVVPDATASADAKLKWRLVVVPKNQLGVAETYVDTRGWTAEDVPAHETLVARLVEAGKADALSHVMGETLRQRLDGWMDRRATLLGEETTE